MPHAPSPSETGWCPPPAAHGLDEHAGPRGYLFGRGGTTVVRHLVADQPGDHRLMCREAPRDLGGEPCLFRDEPYVAVKITACPPRRVPVLARHVTDDEGGDGPKACLDVGVEEVRESLDHGRLEVSGLRHEVRPVAERASDVAAVLGEHRQFLAGDGRVVTSPHARSTGTGPEVGTDPGTFPATLAHMSASRAPRGAGGIYLTALLAEPDEQRRVLDGPSSASPVDDAASPFGDWTVNGIRRRNLASEPVPRCSTPGCSELPRR